MVDFGFDGVGHAPNEAGQPQPNGDRLACGGVQAHGEIERLINDHVVGGAHEVDLHLLGDSKNAVAHNFGENSVAF